MVLLIPVCQIPWPQTWDYTHQFTWTVWMLGICEQCLPVCSLCVKNMYNFVTEFPLVLSGYMIHDYLAIWLGRVCTTKLLLRGMTPRLQSCQAAYGGCQAVLRMLFCLVLKYRAGQLKAMSDLCDHGGRGVAISQKIYMWGSHVGITMSWSALLFFCLCYWWFSFVLFWLGFLFVRLFVVLGVCGFVWLIGFCLFFCYFGFSSNTLHAGQVDG